MNPPIHKELKWDIYKEHDDNFLTLILNHVSAGRSFTCLGPPGVGKTYVLSQVHDFLIDKKEKVSSNAVDLKKKKTLTDNMANRDFIYFLFFMSLIGRVDIFICITAFGSNIFAAYLAYSKIKPPLHAS